MTEYDSHLASFLLYFHFHNDIKKFQSFLPTTQSVIKLGIGIPSKLKTHVIKSENLAECGSGDAFYNKHVLGGTPKENKIQVLKTANDEVKMFKKICMNLRVFSCLHSEKEVGVILRKVNIISNNMRLIDFSTIGVVCTRHTSKSG